MTSSLLAPTETGEQLLRLPTPEFLSRCLKTPGVSPEQAQAFQSKFWKMHIDSQRNIASVAASKTTAVGPNKPAKPETVRARSELLDSSIDPDPDAARTPFHQRIRPGMVVSWKPPAEYAMFSVGGKSYAMVLCPVQAVGEKVKDALGRQAKEVAGEASAAYLCAMVLPSLLPGSFGISPWRQVVVKVDEMEAEMLFEWDEATRYYYMTI